MFRIFICPADLRWRFSLHNNPFFLLSNLLLCRCRPSTRTVLEQVGWVSPGEVVGEAALFTPTARRLTSVLAGEDGVHLAELDRATYNRLAAAADSQVRGAGWALQLWCCW